MAITSWAGIKLINNALDSTFYSSYLKPMTVCFHAVPFKNEKMPVFTGGNHMEYMTKIGILLNRKGIHVQKSNTDFYFKYNIKKIGEKKQNIFLLFLSGKIFIYGLNEKSFLKLKKNIDKNKNGNFTGKKMSDGTFTGVWYI